MVFLLHILPLALEWKEKTMKLFPQYLRMSLVLLLCVALLSSMAACSQASEETSSTAEPAVSANLEVDEPSESESEDDTTAAKAAEEKAATEKVAAEAQAAEEKAAAEKAAAEKLAQEKAAAEAYAAQQAAQAQAAAEDAARQAEAARASSSSSTQSSSSTTTYTESSGSRESSSGTGEITGSPEQTAYWTPGGKSYHFSQNCTSLKRSKTILSGTLQDALDANKTDPCNLCANG